MITVDISMDQHGLDTSVWGLARLTIWNDASGTREKGNYGWAISHQFDSTYGRKAAERTGRDQPEFRDLLGAGPWVWKSGHVTGFQRSKGVVALLAAVMKASKL